MAAAAAAAVVASRTDHIDVTRLFRDIGTLEEQLKLLADNVAIREELRDNTQLKHSFRPMILGVEGFRVEDGMENPLVAAPIGGSSTSLNSKTRPHASFEKLFAGDIKDSERMVLLENSETDTAWYSKFFLGKPHQIMIGMDEDKNVYVLAAMMHDDEELNGLYVRAVLWRKEGMERVIFPAEKKMDFAKVDLLKSFNPMYSRWSRPKEVLDRSIIKEIYSIEEQMNAKRYKFGVVYAREGQLADEEFYGNAQGSKDFERFLQVLGDVVPLKGWEGFRGGLDVTNDNTGERSVYTQFQGHEIMFHVSTMLPFSETNQQQLERKRHIGNDIVVIVFYDGETTPFSPALMRSHFNHVFAVVRKVDVNGSPAYRLALSIKNDVPVFGPPMPYPPLFKNVTFFRRFLLTKLINGEQAALQASSFRESMLRSNDDVLRRMYQTYSGDKAEASKLMKRQSTGRLLIPSPVASSPEEAFSFGNKLKEELLAQQQKVLTAITAHHDRPLPHWKPELFSKAFPLEIRCADVWGDSLIVSTSGGVFLVRPNGIIQQLLEKNNFKQMVVLEAAVTLLALSGGNLYAFHLSRFLEGDTITGKASDFRIDKSKGAHLFCVSNSYTVHDAADDALPSYKICWAVRNQITVHTFTPVDSISSAPVNFKKIKDFAVADTVAVLSFCANDTKLCIGFKTEFHVVSLTDLQTTVLFNAEEKLNPLTALAFNNEVLLCYNNVAIFRDVEGKSTREYQLNWTSAPSGLAHVFPFVLAFTSSAVEVRTLINGKLVQSLPMPNAKFGASKGHIYALSGLPSGATDIYRIIPP